MKFWDIVNINVSGRSDYDNIKAFERELSSLVNTFSKRGVYEDVDEAVQKDYSSGNIKILQLALEWIAYWSDMFKKKMYDDRNRIACERCSKLAEKLEQQNIADVSVCEDLRVSNLNRLGMHRTLVQSATGIILYGMYKECQLYATKGGSVYSDIVNIMSDLSKGDPEHYFGHLPLI